MKLDSVYHNKAIEYICAYGRAQTHCDKFNYGDNFLVSNVNKYKSTINQLQATKNMKDDDRILFISIGGGTGEEIVQVLSQTTINYGILVEINKIACDVFAENSNRLLEGKKVFVFNSDIMSSLEDVSRCIDLLFTTGQVNKIVISIYAVIHELPYRSSDFSLNRMLVKILGNYSGSVLLCREPCIPYNWPNRVSLNIGQINPKNLYDFTSLIKNRLHFSSHVVFEGDYVEMDKDLAIEVLFKFFYISDFDYEIQEKTINIDSDSFVSSIQDVFGGNSVLEQKLISNSFADGYQKFEVTAKDLDGKVLNMPLCFVNVFAKKVT